MDYYQQLSPMNLEQDWFGNPATSYDDGPLEPKNEEEKYGNLPGYSEMNSYSSDYQEQQVPYSPSAPGPIKRVRTNLQNHQEPMDGRTSSSKIGRPQKSGSTTKMASYARLDHFFEGFI